MRFIYDFIKNLKNIKDWHVVKGDPSLYPKAPYDTIKIDDEALDKINDFLVSLRKEEKIHITAPGKSVTDKVDVAAPEDLKEKFFRRSFCSGLHSSLYILPDGKVTICEQLYWHANFVVGDVMTQTLEEIWNSEKAKSIYYLRQEDIPEDSLCHSCSYFRACREGRQVCYREIIRKYGSEKWYYPDAECPFVAD